MIDGETIALSIILSAAVGTIIAYIFRFLLKPKHEEIFNHNRDANLNIIFGYLNAYDNLVGTFFKVFEDSMGDLTDDKKIIVPRPDWKELEGGGRIMEIDPENSDLWKKYEYLKKDLKPTLNHMIENFKIFRDEYPIYLNFLHMGFLEDVSRYYYHTNFYVKWSLGNTPIVDSLKDRLETATKIIKYLKKQKIDKKNLVAVDTFIKKWDENQKSRLYESKKD